MTKTAANTHIPDWAQNAQPLRVGTPVQPDPRRFQHYLDRAFSRGWISNFGILVRELEERLAARFQVPYVLTQANGTTALQLALKLFGRPGPVATPAFSFAATAAAIRWIGQKPCFCDIDGASLTICASELETALQAGAQSILPVHTFGNACDIKAMDALSRQYNAPLIYDAAHAFDISLNGRALLAYGDASVLSFHATNPFHTVEGGALVLHDEAAYLAAREMSNFGLGPSGNINREGTNSKMSEIHAAMGLALLDDFEEISARRALVMEEYRTLLPPDLASPSEQRGTGNMAYFALRLPQSIDRDALIQRAEEQGIGLKAYFTPPLNQADLPKTPPVGVYPESERAAAQTICLPVHPDMSKKQTRMVSEFILHALDDIS